MPRSDNSPVAEFSAHGVSIYKNSRRNLMKTLKRSLCLALALLMLFSLAACGSSDGGEGESGTVSTSNSGWEIDFSGKDYGNYDFKVLRADIETGHSWSGYPNDIYVEEISGDVLGNAVYYRNQTLKEMLNVNIVMEIQPMGNDLTTALSNSIASGDGGYDTTVLHMRGFPTLVNQGLVNDMNNLALDTNYSWWDKAAEEALNIKGKQYAMVSDITYVDKLSTIGIFYNIEMANELHLPDLYDMVNEGTWTWEKMKEYAIAATESGENIWGISAQNDYSYYFMHAANVQTVTKDNNGDLVYKLAYARPVNVLQAAFTAMNESFFFNRQLAGIDSNQVAANFGDHYLFVVRPLQSFYYMKNYEADYGVLPMPKYDDLYEEYYSPVNHHAATLIALPMSNSEYARTADVLQAWGMISEDKVMTEFYNRILSTRMVNDPESAEMLDIIFENRVYDMGLIFNFGNVESTVLLSNANLIAGAAGTIGSSVASAKESTNTAIKNFLEQIK